MSVSAMIYGYRNNFGCKTTTQRKGRRTKLKMFNLITDGYRTVSMYDDDYFISLCQWLMKRGYPCNLSVGYKTVNIDEFFMKALFSVCPSHFEDLMINKSGFNVYDWRKQFDLFNDIEIKGLNFYRRRSSIPIEDFTSLKDIYKIVFTNFGKYNELNNKLKFSFNSCWKHARWILSKRCLISKDKFYYQISYGCKDDYENHKNGKACSNWDITIESEKDENYIDFILKVYENYDAIISGNKDVLMSVTYEGTDDFYLGGNFRFRVDA